MSNAKKESPNNVFDIGLVDRSQPGSTPADVQSALSVIDLSKGTVTSFMARRIVFVDRRVERKQVSATFGGTHQSILIIQCPVVEDCALLHYAKSFLDSPYGDLGTTNYLTVPRSTI